MHAVGSTPAAVPMDATLRAGLWRRGFQLLFAEALYGLILVGAAGSWAWPRAWLYILFSIVLVAVDAAYVLPRNPLVIIARGQGHKDTKTFDKVITPIYAALILSTLVVAGLDAVRFGWAPLSWPWAVLGVALLAAGMVPVAGAMAVNPFLETTVRIQTERGHHVVGHGVYRYVRHPMYVGSLIQYLALPLVLGSAWAFVPAVACMVCLVVRTALEDATLRWELPGYEEYARVTRYRLVPGIW